MIFNAIAAVILAAGMGLSYWQYTKILGREVAIGSVTALEPHRGSKGGTTYSVIAQFCDRSGREHTYHSSWSASSTGFNVGDPIRICFDRDNPDDCGVLSFGYRFGVGWILTVVGAAMLIAHVGWSFGNKWLQDRFPTTVPGQPAYERETVPAAKGAGRLN